MKKVILIILNCLLLISLSACRVKEAYIPSGEIYLKTSPAHGDAGVIEVLDVEIDNKEYQIGSKINFKIGVGQLELYFSKANLSFSVFEKSNNEYKSIHKEDFEYLNFSSDKFSCIQSKKSLMSMIIFIAPSYPHFYPTYHENISYDLSNIDEGYVLIQLSLDEYFSRSIKINFSIIDDKIIFSDWIVE